MKKILDPLLHQNVLLKIFRDWKIIISIISFCRRNLYNKSGLCWIKNWEKKIEKLEKKERWTDRHTSTNFHLSFFFFIFIFSIRISVIIFMKCSTCFTVQYSRVQLKFAQSNYNPLQEENEYKECVCCTIPSLFCIFVLFPTFSVFSFLMESNEFHSFFTISSLFHFFTYFSSFVFIFYINTLLVRS